MRNRNPIRNLLLLTAAGLMLLGSFGCAETVGDIDRTQPGKIDKQLFRADKTWYFKQTVVDTSANATSLFVGIPSEINKIRFEVTAAKLNAYRVHESRPGRDPDVDVNSKEVGDSRPLDGRGFGIDPEYYKEDLIGAWEITDHFDVIRQYNATTGEQQNVLVENREDRPWYEREYMRVNWGANLAPNYNLLDADLTGILVETTVEGESDNDPRNAPHWEDAAGNVYDSRDRTLNDDIVYFDHTAKWHLPGGNGTQDAWVRSSFARIDNLRDQDYEVAMWDDRRQSKFGYFRTERFAYDRRRSFTDSGELFMANTHRIWQASYQRDNCETLPDRISDNRIDRESEAAKGNATRNELSRLDREFVILAEGQDTCDRGDVPFKRNIDRSRIPIPFADRVPHPVVYVANYEHPEQLMDTVRQIAADWNSAFRRATAHQCGVAVPGGTTAINDVPSELPGGESPAGLTCAELKAAGVVPDMFVLVENRDGSIRNGDVRRNFIYWVDQPSDAGPLGYGPSFADPETGEMISGTAYVYGAAVDTYAAYAMDIIDVLDGFLTLDNLKNGQQIKEWIARNRDKVDPRRIAAAQAKGLGISTDEYLQMDVRDAIHASLSPDQLATIDAIEHEGLPEGNPLFEKFQMDKIKGTELEALLFQGQAGDEILGAFSNTKAFRDIAPDWRPGDSVPAEALEIFAPSHWMFGSAMREMTEEDVQFHSSKNIYKAEFADDSIIGLALEYQKESDPEKVYQDLRSKIYRAVMLHEIGHTVGLRHNFEGSFDAFNFHDEYWDLRRENLGDEDGQHLALSDNLTGARVGLEAEFTETQQRLQMTEYSYSSIMDYSMKFNGDFSGLGKYDHAAVLMGYADAVEVFDQTSRQDVMDNMERFLVRFSGANNLDMEEFLEENWEDRTHPRDNHPLKFANYTHIPYWLDGQSIDGGLTSLRTRSTRNFTELKAQRDEGQDVPLEVPYMFCGDEWVSSIMSCNRWDQGANFFEINSNALKAYSNYYFFDHFRRDRKSFSAQAAAQRVYSRYFKLMTDTYRFGLWAGVLWGSGADPVQTSLWRDAINLGFQSLLNVLSTPEYGSYVQQNDGRWHHWSWETENPAPGTFTVNQGVGRRRYTRYYWDEGYNYYNYPLESGHFWDWSMALVALTESTFTLLGNETQSDFRTYSIPYYLWYTQPLTRWFNAMSLRDSDAISPRVVNGSMQFLGIYDDGEDGDPVNIRPNWTMQYYGMLYGMAGFKSNWSLAYADQMKVFRVGGGETVSPSGDFEVYEAHDTLSGVTYASLTKLRWDPEACFVDGRGAIGDWVPDYPDAPSNLADQWNVSEVTPPPALILREMRCMQIQKEAIAQEDRRRDALERRINDKVEQLNLLRSLYAAFGQL